MYANYVRFIRPFSLTILAFNLVVTLPTLIVMFEETKGKSLEEIDLMFGDRALGNLPTDIEKVASKAAAEDTGNHDGVA